MKIQVNFSSKMINLFSSFYDRKSICLFRSESFFLHPSLFGVISYDCWHFVGPCGCAHTRDHVNELGRGFK